MLRRIKPFVPSGTDFELARRFFEELGFAIVWQGDGMAEMAMGKVAFILQAVANAELQDNLILQVEVDDLDHLWQHIEQSGVLGRYPASGKRPTVFPWGSRELHLIDPAGVCWRFVGCGSSTS